MPGSPPREQIMDQNKPGSRVILKGPAWERVDSALEAFTDDWQTKLDIEQARAFAWVCGLVAQAEGKSAEHRLSSRYVLMNVNTEGGWAEMERLERLGGAARVIARKCQEVIACVLDGLDDRGYWCGWGFDAEVAERREAAADRRKASVLATEEDAHRAIEAYYKLMLTTDRSAGAAEAACMEMFDCGAWKVRRATREYREALDGEAS